MDKYKKRNIHNCSTALFHYIFHIFHIWIPNETVFAGAKQCGGHQGDHQEEPCKEPEPSWQGDQDPEGADRVAPRQRRCSPRLQGKLSSVQYFCRISCSSSISWEENGFIFPATLDLWVPRSNGAVWKTRSITFLRAGASRQGKVWRKADAGWSHRAPPSCSVWWHCVCVRQILPWVVGNNCKLTSPPPQGSMSPA